MIALQLSDAVAPALLVNQLDKSSAVFPTPHSISMLARFVLSMIGLVWSKPECVMVTLKSLAGHPSEIV